MPYKDDIPHKDDERNPYTCPTGYDKQRARQILHEVNTGNRHTWKSQLVSKPNIGLTSAKISGSDRSATKFTLARFKATSLTKCLGRCLGGGGEVTAKVRRRR